VNHIRLFWRIFFPFLLPLALLSFALILVLLSTEIQSAYFIASISSITIAIAASYWSARRLANSLIQIKNGVERIAQIDSSKADTIDSIDSMDSLSKAVNDLARLLRERAGEHSQHREEHDMIVSSMVEGVLVVDADERLVSFNPAAAMLLGIDEGVLGRTLQEAIRNSELNRLVTKTLELGVSAVADITLNGVEERYLQATSTILTNQRRERTGALIVLNDVTHSRKLEQVRRDFVANVSHELKTPITSIKGYVETLLDGAFRNPDEAERFLKIVAKQSNRLDAIIEDLLRLSRIEQGVERGEIALERVALKGILVTAIAACETRTQSKDAAVALTCPDGLVARINPPLFEQAIINLIDNAAKYGPVGNTIEVTAAEKNGTISIRVRDHGNGIAPEHLPRLFERFYRVDKARSRSEGGTGLGLAIAKHIVMAHCGTISVDSQVGEGSTFTILLPLG
jgi:two-component system, OmpR family, phosphate regulon sensor histidine kinase PhoR